jgi:nucleotide-binding universal stress UspA family protein
MIKGRAPFPFETIALALAFSPRLEALIAETGRLARLHGARAIFIHVGKKTPEKQRQLAGFLNHYGFNDANSAVVWEQGQPVDSIIRVCKEHVVDLLIIGALQKENMLQYYMGSVSREVSRKAKCSVLMITEPNLHPAPFRRVVVNGHDHGKTRSTLETALYFSRKEGVEELMVATEVDIPALSMSLANGSTEQELDEVHLRVLQEEEARWQRLLQQLDAGPIRMQFRALPGKSGHTIRTFAVEQEADLLIVNSPDHHLSIFDRIFPHDLEYLLSDMPCSLLIVHSRMPEQPL